MKKLTRKSFQFIPALAGVAIGLLSGEVQAQNVYFNPSGGITSGGSYSWDAASWTTSSTSTVRGNFTQGSFARFYLGSSATPYTITANATESVAGLYEHVSGQTLTINGASGGQLSLPVGSTTTALDPTINVQGFLCTGTVIVNCPIIGPGGIQHSQSQPLYLNATNSYAGGTWTTGGQLIYFNNSYAFGTGTIFVGGSADAIINSSGQALTITNKVLFQAAGYNFNLAGGNAVGGQPGLTFTGPWFLQPGLTTLYLSSGATQVMAISNVISGSGASVNIADNGTLILAATNTYSGSTTVGTAPLTGTAPSVEIAGAIAGDLNVTNGAKLVTLDHPATLKSTAKVFLSSALAANTVALNYSGTMTVLAVYIDGVVQAGGTWGSPTSGADNISATFTGPGLLKVAAAPVIVAEPVSVSVYPQTPSRTFSVAVTGDQPSMQYQWKLNSNNLIDNGSSIFGAQTATLTVAPPYTAGTYTCAINNVAGATNTLPVTLTILATNSYVNTVLQDSPIAYWRLDETSGSLAYDAVGGNVAQYNNVTLNQPGFSVTDTDPAISLPTSAASRGYAVVTNTPNPFLFLPATPTFSFEGWINSTNFSTKQTLFSTLDLTAPGGYAFRVLPGGTALEFTAGGLTDNDTPTLPNALVVSNWYHLVCTYDGNNFVFYVNGNPVGNLPLSATVKQSAGAHVPLVMGCNPPAYVIPTGDHGAEQVMGSMDEMAVYNYPLTQLQVTNHFLARYGTLQVPVVFAPNANPPTNYVSLSSTLEANAAGQALNYQWYKAPSTLLSGQTGSSLTLSPLQLSDAGSYYVSVSNPAGSSNSPSTYLAVLPIPTSASQLNLTNGLVLHLPFDGDYTDISGRSHNGANVGATTFVTDGQIGGKALRYNTDTGAAQTNYVTLGSVSDLQFSSNIDFTVSYWVRQPANSTFTNLPFFCDTVGSISGITGLSGGFCFAPYATDSSAGGWQLGIGSTTHSMATVPSSGLLNDGNWHHLMHVFSRKANVTTYLDGAQVDSEAINYIDDISTTRTVNIGQDASGAYPVTATADLDDLAVWNRALSKLEVSGAFLAGATNHVSVAPVVVTAPPLTPTTISGIAGNVLSYTGGSGTHFVLLGTNNLAAPQSTWPRLLTNSATPGTFTLPTSPNSSMFYRVTSEN